MARHKIDRTLKIGVIEFNGAVLVAGAGAGALAVTQNDAIDYALDKGVIPHDSGGGSRPDKARILAMLALTKTASREDIERIFREY